MIKLIASDIDGTLANGQLEISDKNAQAIKEAQQRGIVFCVATGRDYRETFAPLDEQKITCPMITLNGAQIIDENHQTFDLTTIDFATAHKLWELFEKNDIYAELMTNKGVFSKSEEKRLCYFIAYVGETMPHLTHQDAEELAQSYLQHFHAYYTTDVMDVARRKDIEVLKYFVADIKTEKLEKLCQNIKEKFPDLIITSSGTYNIEINHKDAQKGIAVLKLAKQYRVTSAEIMTLGDSLNDVSMLKMAKISVAMGNAEDKIKDVANHLTTSNEESGVAKAIWHVLNGEWN